MRVRGHFRGPVRVDDVYDLGGGHYRVVVRTESGSLGETTLSDDDIAAGDVEVIERAELVKGDEFFDLMESHRIDLAYSHDPNFAVSLSGVRGLPHQIVAVYRHMLPQARLRLVLADDPGAGKTIMAGLLIKELRLRSAADRVLVLCPAPLTFQWREELEEKFDEPFEILDSQRVKWGTSGNAWEQYDRCIASIDFAKRDEVKDDLLRAEWDLVVIDEAHKCSAVTYIDSEDKTEKLDRTKRYALAEALSRKTERLILATATPHSGDRSRFQNFLKLLDPDQFGDQELAAEQIGREDSPYFLRRVKEDLRDEHGGKLFVPRNVLSQPFTLSAPELELYEAVTEYIGEFLGAAAGRRGTAVALARTVLQRRLASSLGAIRSSLHNRAGRITARLEEVEALPPEQRARRLAELRVLDLDVEQDIDDATEEQEDLAAQEVVVGETLEQMRVEVARLRELTIQADQTIAVGEEAKLTALRRCLESAELAELRDGRAKLLIFTEHRDTLEYLLRNLTEWGYDTCSIHGGLPPRDRKRVQQLFHQEKQICVATEAAGEGINLQFCHLMINYDLPWNPVRLEQRMGRIHRIGQESTCVIFNFVADNTIEGKLLGRLLEKLKAMEEDLGGRVYDVVGEMLAHNGLDFEQLMREALLNPERRAVGEREIAALDADALKGYEQDIGIAQATKHVDMAWVRERDWRSEERRLMPEFVETFFARACKRLGVRLEPRQDQRLYRIEHVPRTLLHDDLKSVRRLGRADSSYRKLTFRKEVRQRAEHEDAVLLSPGHPLFAALSEVLQRELRAAEGAVAPFIAPWVTEPYAIHFFTHRVRGLNLRGEQEDVFAELVAASETPQGFELVGPDLLHDLTPADFEPIGIERPDEASIERATNFVRVEVQQQQVRTRRHERLEQADLRAEYLRESMDAQLQRLQQKWSELDDRVYRGDDDAALARDEADRRIRELERRRDEKLAAFEQLGIVRPGEVRYLGTALAGPWPGPEEPAVEAMRNDPEVEHAAMLVAVDAERAAGWEPEDVSEARDGRGFDIRSVRRSAEDGQVEVRRIEVKGRAAAAGDVALCRTEWIAAHRHGESYWLYVVYGATAEQPRLVRIQDPAARLAESVREVRSVTTFFIPGKAIEAVSG